LRNTESENARQIAEKRLSSLVRATVNRPINDSAELHGRVCLAHILYKAGDEKYPNPKNTVDSYNPATGAAQVPPPPPPPPVGQTSWGENVRGPSGQPGSESPAPRLSTVPASSQTPPWGAR
jgi:hypothetical protein